MADPDLEDCERPDPFFDGERWRCAFIWRADQAAEEVRRG